MFPKAYKASLLIRRISTISLSPSTTQLPPVQQALHNANTYIENYMDAPAGGGTVIQQQGSAQNLLEFQQDPEAQERQRLLEEM